MKDLARFKFNYSECEPLVRERWRRVKAFMANREPVVRNTSVDKALYALDRDLVYDWLLWQDNRQKGCLADSDNEVGNEEKGGN